MNILQDILKLSRNLVMKEPFYGMFLSTLNKTVTKEVPIAAVRKHGINLEIAFNPDEWEKRPENIRYGILKHELLHICFYHLTMRSRYSDKKLFNIAADIEINQYIEDQHKNDEFLNHADFNLPAEKGTDFYYKALQQMKGKNELLDNLLQQMDSHATWVEIDESSTSEKSLIEKQVDHQLLQADKTTNNRGRGYLPDQIVQRLGKLFEKKEPVIDWKAFFRRFTGGSTKYYTKKSKRKESTRFEGNPGLKIKQKNHVFIALDTSGSVSSKEFEEFMSEVTHIHKAGTEVTLCHTDATVAHVEVYNPKKPINRYGYGGTDFDPAIEYFNKHKSKYTSMVYFTDGECTVPKTKPHKSMLWVISSSGRSLSGLPGVQIKMQSTK